MRSAELLGTGVFTVMLALPMITGPSDAGQHLAQEQLWRHPQVARDLKEIKHDTLRVLLLTDPLTFEKRPGAMTGLEWELLERFARKKHLHIKPVPVADQDSMLEMLQKGAGDVIAAQLSPTGWASAFTSHTRPYRRVARTYAYPRTLANGKESPRYEKPDTLVVSVWSPFLDSLQRLDPPDSNVVVRLSDQLPEALLTRAAVGASTMLLVTDATASMEAKRLPLVRFGPRMGRSTPLSFAVRSNAPHLLHALDTWLALANEHEARKALISAYDNGLDTRGPLHSFRAFAFGGDTISPYDSLFQVHADSLAWDWKLLAAVAYKESRFDTSAISYAGAGGLMQMMPATAALMGVSNLGGVDGHIQGAAKYLGRLDQIWRKEVPAPAQRLKFVLAAYNAGPGHVKDAQRLAKELGLDPDRWDGNVERAIVLLNRPRYFTLPFVRTGYCRGQDTYWYVRDVVRLFAWLRGKDPK